MYLGILCREADISIRLRRNACSGALAPEAQRAPSGSGAPVRSARILPCAQSVRFDGKCNSHKFSVLFLARSCNDS